MSALASRLAFCCFVWFAVLSLGCTARVIPPQGVVSPQRVWLLSYDLHPSLVFAQEPDQLVMFEYGEWQWFAQKQTHWSRVFAVFIWPTQGSLSRRALNMSASSNTLEVVYAFEANQGWAIDVEQELAQDLLVRLEDRYRSVQSSAYYRRDLDTWFVKDPASYHMLRTCSEVMADWLRDLDCSVRGMLWTWKWSVATSPDAAP